MLLADAINTSSDGKVNMLSQFDRILSYKYPAMHPKLVVWVRLVMELSDHDRQMKTALRLLDPDGNLLFAIERPMMGPPKPPGQWKATGINAIIPMVGLVFPAPGDYAFTFEVDDEEKGRAPLTLDQVDPGWRPEPAQELR